MTLDPTPALIVAEKPNGQRERFSLFPSYTVPMLHDPSHSSGVSAGHRWAFLVNPVSGSGLGRHVQERLAESLARIGLSPDRWTSDFTRPGAELIDQVAQLSQNYDRIVVAGGDGTIGLSLQGLQRGAQSACALGVIPMGTGNDLARELRLLPEYRQGGLDSLLEAFLLDRTAPLDLWSINGVATMVNYISLGLDGKSTEAFANRRVLGGAHSILANKLRFAQSGILSLTHRLPADFRIRLHRGGVVQDVQLSGRRTLAIHNISHYAAGLMRVADTRPDDGLLTVTCFPTMGTYGACLLRRLFTRGRIGGGMLPTWKADRVECFWTGDVGLQIDGEGREDLRECGHLDIRAIARVQVLVGNPEGKP